MTIDFSGAVTAISTYAGGQFEPAYTKLTTPPLKSPATELTPEQKKEQQAWQGQMSASFKQLADARSQGQQQAGYDQVVALMTTTATTAATVCTQIVTIMNALPTSGSTTQQIAFQTNQINQINALREVLTALAALSPAAIWQSPPASGSKQ